MSVSAFTALEKSAACMELPQEVVKREPDRGQAQSPLIAHKQNSSMGEFALDSRGRTPGDLPSRCWRAKVQPRLEATRFSRR